MEQRHKSLKNLLLWAKQEHMTKLLNNLLCPLC